MVDLDELIEKWKNSALNFKEAEMLINLLIIHNGKIEKKNKDAYDVAYISPELNMGNYDQEEVSGLNNAMIEVCSILEPEA